MGRGWWGQGGRSGRFQWVGWWDQGGGGAWESRDWVVWVKGMVESTAREVKGEEVGLKDGGVTEVGVKGWGGEGLGVEV